MTSLPAMTPPAAAPTWRQWLSTFGAMVKKEFTLMTRYPVEFVASFGQVFLVVVILTLAGLMFSPEGAGGRDANGQTAGLVVYGFVLFMFVTQDMRIVMIYIIFQRNSIRWYVSRLYKCAYWQRAIHYTCIFDIF